MRASQAVSHVSFKPTMLAAADLVIEKWSIYPQAPNKCLWDAHMNGWTISTAHGMCTCI
jgi:hypothetical protein